ncbi:DEAD/DEAH box helicase [Deinococcus ruber]|uniref:DEAD/DEAH box helicase n=1 Tax=Deinococcus ruber TaxID=1848197 RepID=A0A918CEH9_9DEIO|nr:DEAD/DEAH box helicase [Deinococcus ruber]GGR17169.1 hypothetical protein GCM10008957_32220 [Deinococcus ruber]
MLSSLTLAPTGSVLLTAPTGSGKTHAAREAARASVAQGHTVLMIVPLKALAAEIQAQWQAALPEAVVAHYTSDQRRHVPYQEANILLMTPERLDLCTRSWRRHNRWLARVDLVIVDEVHLMQDKHRGARLDAGLTRLRAVAPLIRLLAMSATVGEPQTLAAWLGAVHQRSEVRRVPLHWTAHIVASVDQKQTQLLSLLQQHSTLVFVNSRRRAEELATWLRLNGQLADAHHAGLPMGQRHEVEARFRSGETRVLCCTAALEMGLNFPCETVVLYDLSLWHTGVAEPISHVTAWQRAGRAGRTPGQLASVQVIGLKKEAPAQYLRPDFEPLRSPLGQDVALQDFVLGSIDGGLARTSVQLQRLLRQSFAAHTGSLDPRGAVAALISGGGLEEHGDTLHVTLLGRVASQALLPLRAMACVNFLPNDPCVLDALLTLCRSALTSGPRLNDAAELLTEPLLQLTPSRLLDAGEWFPAEQLALAGLLLSACQQGDEECAAAYGLYAADVRAVREEAARVLDAWCTYRPEDRKLSLIRTMLHAQLSLDHATLALLPGIGTALARSLAHAGFEDIETLAMQPTDALPQVPGIRAARLVALIQAAEQLVKRLESDPTREPPAATRSVLPLDWRGQTDPLRLQRARALAVVQDGDGYLVTGGAAPHRVTAALACDCLDHTRRRRCKHVLATERFLGNAAIVRNTQLLELD